MILTGWQNLLTYTLTAFLFEAAEFYAVKEENLYCILKFQNIYKMYNAP